MKGPHLRIVASCDRCEYVKVTPYRVQGDSGRDVECAHPDAQGYIGEQRFDSTPQWCALLREALAEFTRGNPQHRVNRARRRHPARAPDRARRQPPACAHRGAGLHAGVPAPGLAADPESRAGRGDPRQAARWGVSAIAIDDPFAVAVIRTVARENVRRMLVAHQSERIRHFEGRIHALGLNSADYLIVILNVDDPNGAALAGVLMPGHDWSPIRASGQVPFARGLASRPALQDALTGDAARELASIGGIAVLAMDRGIIAAFTLAELAS